jgi:pimeloyl-ACP methyl ester carboxylesterase
MGRVALFDKRGTGLSDRPSHLPSNTELVPDVLAVMDAAGMESAALVGWIDAAALALEVAASHPQRVTALVLGETLATNTPDEDHPWAPNETVLNAVADAIEEGMWGQAILLPMIAPAAATDERIRNWFKRMERMAATPSMAANLLRRTTELDVRHLLPSVAVPALLLHRQDAALLPTEGIRWLAEHLPSGRYVELPGDEVPGYLGDVDGLMDEVEEFLVGTRIGSRRHRRVATVLFSDIVGSTERAATEGDARWRSLLDNHRREARRLLVHFQGLEIDTAGDGFLIAFDSPSRSQSTGSRSPECQGRAPAQSGVDTLPGDVVSRRISDRPPAISAAVVHAIVTIATVPGVSPTLVDHEHGRDGAAGKVIAHGYECERRSAPK